MLRLPFVVFSLLIVIWTFQLARCWFPTRTALLTATLLAISPYQVYFAQEVRMYTMAAALTLGGVICYLRLRQHAFEGWVYRIGFPLLFIAALHTHYFTSFILAAVNLDFFTQYVQAKRRAVSPPAKIGLWMFLNAIIVLACLPWFVFVVSHPAIGRVRNDWRLAMTLKDGFTQLRDLFFQMTAGYFVYPNDLNHALAHYPQSLDSAEARRFFQHRLLIIGLGIPAMTGMAFKGIWHIRRHAGELLGFFFIPLLLVIIVMFVSQRELVLSRYLMIVSPYFFITVAAGMMSLRNVRVKTLTTSVLLLAMGLSLMTHYQNAARESDYRPVADLIRREYQIGDLIVVDPTYMDRTLQYYFSDNESIWRAVINTDSADSTINYLTTHHSMLRIWLILDYRSELFAITQQALQGLWPSYKIHRDERFPDPTAKVRVLQLRGAGGWMDLPTLLNQSIFSPHNHAKTQKTTNESFSKILIPVLKTQGRATKPRPGNSTDRTASANG
jgi:uncharacterized membrane protein